MQTYLVEAYQPQAGAHAVSARARAAAEAVTRAGKPVRYVRSICVPADETCFHVFESSSKEVVLEAVARAAFEFTRVAEAVS